MTTSRSDHDVVVVGAGPAGLAAAARAASAGLSVAVVDAGTRPGGQYWRQPSGAMLDDERFRQLHHDLGTYRMLSESLDRAISTGSVVHLAGHHAWTVGRDGEGFAVHAVDASASGSPGSATTVEREVRGRRLVLAPGAYDRQVPFPGWTLPGVLTAGGVQALLKGHGVVAGRRIVVAGTGPFLLPVAAGLAQAGAHVVGVHEAASPVAWVSHLPAVLRNATKLGEGLGYARTLARHRVPVRTRSVLVGAHGAESVEAVTVARADGKGGVAPGSEERIEADTLAVGWGFTPQLELPLALACATRVDVDGSLVCVVDDTQQSSVPDVYIAGEACGVGGAALAVVEGEIAGRAVAGTPVDDSLRRRRTALRRFAAAMHQAHPVPPGWMARLQEDTVVCRCEEVTTARLRAAVEEQGARDARAAKLLVRTGMGWCQGRVCGYATACLTARWTGTPYDPAVVATRPVAAPVSLGTLALTDSEER
ncbi:MAG TPA: FAD/NAD(P)-binding oxidoreductase [Marmoricola sp.]|nr:FAD/NAD(P)-binding oxidoreductase [Marmoricola sp.]